MIAVQIEQYVRRAKDFSKGVLHTEQSKETRHSAALLAIHSAISYADALRLALGDAQLYADDHRRAAESLRRLLRARGREDKEGLPSLEVLLKQKHSVAYGKDRLDESASKLLVTKADRFATWASKTGKELQLEGWQHEDR